MPTAQDESPRVGISAVRPSTYQLGMIGISGYAGVLLGSLQVVCDRRSCRLAAVTSTGEDRDRQTALELWRPDCRSYADYQHMLALARPLDLCIIPTGIHWHTRMSLDALAAHAHVLVEKPLAGSVENARRIITAARQGGKFVAVGFQDLYSPVTRQIKAFLLSQRLGAIRSVYANGSWLRSKDYFERNDWAGRSQVDGWHVRDSPINNAFAHFLNLALFFSGSGELDAFPAIASCAGVLYRCYPIETYDTVSVKLTTDTCVDISCVFTHADTEHADPVIHIIMDRGELVWRFEREAVAINERGETVGRWCLPTAEASRRDMLNNVIDCLDGGQTPLCPADMALHHCMAVETIETTLPIQPAPRQGSLDTEVSWAPRTGLFQRLLREAWSRCHGEA